MTEDNTQQTPDSGKHRHSGKRSFSRKARLGIGAAVLLGLGAAAGVLTSFAVSSWAHAVK